RRARMGFEEGLELPLPASPDGLRELAFKIAEERERRLDERLFAHEEKRYLRRQHQDEAQELRCLCDKYGGKPVTKGPIADLVVVLRERNKGRRRQVGRRGAARDPTVRAHLALIDKALRKGPRNLADAVFRVVAIVAADITARGDVDGVVEVVVPLGGERARPSVLMPLEPARLVAVVLENQE